MHSSRMRTARLLPACTAPGEWGVCWGGYLPGVGGVWSWGCALGGGGVLLGVVCSGGGGGIEGSASGTGGVSQHAMGQTHPTVNRIVGTSF